MKICKVNSLPLKEVIENLASCMNVEYYQSCGEYYLEIPSKLGKGQIRGINFDNGFGIIIYQCQFLEDVRIDFTVTDIHPIKYIYSLKGPIQHRFANENSIHEIKQNTCAIVASENTSGHVISFKKNMAIEIISLEINREEFLQNTYCEISGIAKELRELYKDVKANKTFYHEGFYGLGFKTLFADISKYENQKLIRKFYLESISLQIFVKQLVLFEDDQLNESDKTILRINELQRVEQISIYIEENLDQDLSITKLSQLTALNPNKLQKAFKYLYNSTVNEYITNIRLENSCKLLKDRELLVSEVALRVGISNYSYFSKIFKQKYKISPSDFKSLKI
ncbi:helix-turn-helix domain-containing protein [Kordia jejudonensis]|uniref:helix-turn-helix domain-containing protein n=1 Tax=Kordia jejudonensis TaxID=1348245 RepID=UPI000629AEBC|nr:AraC family transcriptional regulator [Kordia jejudonensis]